MELPQAKGTEPLVEVGPEILWPLVEHALKIDGGLAEPAGPEVGAALIVVVQRREQRRARRRRSSRPAGVAWSYRAADAVEPGARPAPGSRQVEQLRDIPAGRIDLGRLGERPTEARPMTIARSSRSVRIACSERRSGLRPLSQAADRVRSRRPGCC